MARWLVLGTAAVLLLAGLTVAQSDSSGSPSCKYTDDDGTTYDINVLRKMPRTGSTLESDNYKTVQYGGYDDATNQQLTDYDFYINVCGEINAEADDVASGAGMLQTEPGKNGSYIGGTIDNARLFSLRDGDLRYTYGPGQKSQSCVNSGSSDCEGRKTIIIFFCADVGYGTPTFADEISHLQYLFVWNTCAACPTDSELYKKCGPKPVEKCSFIGGNTGLSTGTILLIIFLVVFLFYLIVGILFNRFVAGKTGLEMIPNHNFWGTLFSAIKDGCMFMATCGKRAPVDRPVSYNKIYSTGLEIDDDDSDIDDDAEEEKLYS